MPKVQIRVVLVRPLYQWNIGSVSRAMANMGFEELILISPRTEIGYPAQQAAATGQEALKNRKHYSTWGEFFEHEPESIRLSFSARDGVLHPLWPAREVLRKLKSEHPQFASSGSEQSSVVHFVFGSEDSGLTNEDCSSCHMNLLLPVFGANPSLNLSQAVLLALLIGREEWGQLLSHYPAQNASRQEPFSMSKASPQHQQIQESIQLWLNALGMNFDERRVSAQEVLTRLLLHHIPTEKEFRILQTALRQTHRKLTQTASKDLSQTKVFRSQAKKNELPS